MGVFSVQLIAFGGFLLYGSFFEWALHKWALHTKLPFLEYTYRTHQLEHHVDYRADASFESSDPNVQDHGRFKAWDYLGLILFHLPMILALGWAIGVYIAPGCVFSIITYILLFDFLHHSFHVPRGRFYERHRWFRWIKEHHRVHHLRQNRNLNVVFPLADLALRTRRSD